MNAAQKLIVYLFTKGEPLTKAECIRFLEIDKENFETVLTEVSPILSAAGLTLIDDGKEIELRTLPEAAALVEAIRKEAFSRDIGKAGIETLAVLLYKGPTSRSEIDYIRGVNSSHILRALSMRGLVRRIPHPKDDRAFLYEPTTELLAHLGVSKIDELPEFASVKSELRTLMEERAEVEKENAATNAETEEV